MPSYTTFTGTIVEANGNQQTMGLGFVSHPEKGMLLSYEQIVHFLFKEPIVRDEINQNNLLVCEVISFETEEECGKDMRVIQETICQDMLSLQDTIPAGEKVLRYKVKGADGDKSVKKLKIQFTRHWRLPFSGKYYLYYGLQNMSVLGLLKDRNLLTVEEAKARWGTVEKNLYEGEGDKLPENFRVVEPTEEELEIASRIFPWSVDGTPTAFGVTSFIGIPWEKESQTDGYMCAVKYGSKSEDVQEPWDVVYVHMGTYLRLLGYFSPASEKVCLVEPNIPYSPNSMVYTLQEFKEMPGVIAPGTVVIRKDIAEELPEDVKEQLGSTQSQGEQE